MRTMVGTAGRWPGRVAAAALVACLACGTARAGTGDVEVGGVPVGAAGRERAPAAAWSFVHPAGAQAGATAAVARVMVVAVVRVARR